MAAYGAIPVVETFAAGILEGQDRMAWQQGNYDMDSLVHEGCCDWLEVHWLG